MAVVKLPQLGESVTEGTILRWMKEPGDPVAFDDPLCEIETEKVTAELPSPFEGTMGEILVPQGETVAVDTPLCTVLGAGESANPAANPKLSAKPAPSPVGGWSGGPMAIPPGELPAAPLAPAATAGAPALPAVAAAPLSNGPRSPEDRSRFYSPVVLKLARENNLDLARVAGSGVGGRVTRQDVLAFLAAPPAAAPVPATGGPAILRGALAMGDYDVVELSATRRTIARNLTRSNLEAPQVWTMVEVDVTGLAALRAREKERFERVEGVPLTFLPYFVQAVCESLREFPVFNARWEGGELRRYRRLNAGIAVAAEQGLIVPVIHDAGEMSVAGLAHRIHDLATRAAARKLRIEDVQGGTFTVDNTGAFGSIASKPLVNYPEVAIVTLERVVKRPVVVAGDAIAVRSIVNVCLSFDHRAADGLEAGRFLAAIKRRLEEQ